MAAEPLKTLISHAEAWPREDQEELAEYARVIEARRRGIYVLSDAERSAVEEGRAQADKSEFVPDHVVAAADNRFRG